MKRHLPLSARKSPRFGLALGALGLLGAPLAAQDFAELDRLSDASVQEAAGIELARAQAQRGEILEALSTLSRVLAAHPKANAARLLEVYYLCKSDDRLGAIVALGKIKRKAISDEALTMIETECNPDRGARQ